MPEMRRRLTASRKIALVLSSIGVTLLLLEAGFRVFFPNYLGPPPETFGPVVVEFDPDLGWRNRPGSYRASYQVNGQEYGVTITIGPSGERQLGAPDADTEGTGGEIAVVGCSNTFGWGVSDGDTYSASLARAFPRYRFVNLAANAYGTYQALLSLERRYAQAPPPKAVIYGFIAHHAERNVASREWTRTVTVFSRERTPLIPYVSLSADGRLERRAPRGVDYPPLCAWSKLCRNWYLLATSIRADPRLEPKDELTEMLITAMGDWAARHGAIFIVALLDREPVPRYDTFVRERRIAHVRAEPGYRMLPYDRGHPGWAFHVDVAERLERTMRDLGL
jgi:hypothetical protein